MATRRSFFQALFGGAAAVAIGPKAIAKASTPELLEFTPLPPSLINRVPTEISYSFSYIQFGHFGLEK